MSYCHTYFAPSNVISCRSLVINLKGDYDPTQTVFLVCFSCLLQNRLVMLHDVSLVNMQSVWNYFHSNQMNINQRVNKIVPIYKLRQHALLMHSEMKIANLIIAWHYNCTKITCDFQNWGLQTNYYTRDMNLQFTSVGATFPGFKFSIVGKATNEQTFNFSHLRLLGKAFSLSVKFVLLISVSLIFLFLKYGVGFKNTVFWLYSVALEQGSLDKGLSKLYLRYLVSNWLLVLLYLRILYTTDIYTDITSIPVPTVL